MSDDKKTPQHCYVLALTEMENAFFDKVNPHFNSRYSSYNSVRQTTTTTLAKYDLALSEKTTYQDGQFVLISEVRHITGEIVNSSSYPLNCNNKPQEIGSEMTYARRYNRSMLCGIASEEDDDANGANDAPEQNVQKGKTALKQALNDLTKELNKLTDQDTAEHLIGLWQDMNADLKQARVDLPDFFVTVTKAKDEAKARIESAIETPFN